MKVATLMDELFERELATLSTSWKGLPDKPEETPELSLRTLWLAAAEAPVSIARADTDLPELDDNAILRLRDLVHQRTIGVPLAHLTGRQCFMGLEMLCGPEALIPRRETEMLAAAAVDLAMKVAAERESLTVVDLCTGSGNVALAIAAHVPQARVFGADLSEDAVALARRNSEFLGLSDRVRFDAGDLYAPYDNSEFIGKVDVLTCNPPYISSAKVPAMAEEISSFEPRLAFDGGAFGVDILFRLVSNAPRFLRPGGWLCFEVGLGQGARMAAKLERSGAYTQVRTVKDAAGEIRTIIARR